MTELGRPIQGVTLYSFTRPFHGRRLTVEDLIREVARRGLGPAVEIVGFQAIRGFPAVDDAFVRRFRNLMDSVGLIPSACGANADAYMRRDRRLTNDEMVAYMEAQIATAAKLCFPIVRVQFSVTPEDMERLLPVAERHDVRLGMEIHAHHSVKHPVMAALLERYEKLGSPHLGFIPDWGASMVKVPEIVYARFRERGVPAAFMDVAAAKWAEYHQAGPVLRDEIVATQIAELGELGREWGLGGIGDELAVSLCGLFGHQRAEDWADVLPWAVHTHGKFYEIDAAGNEPSVPIPDILKLYLESGYSRVIFSEWEGFHFDIRSDPFDVVAAQQRLLRRTAEALGSRLVTDAAEAGDLWKER